MSPVAFSALICTYNRPEGLLRAALRSLVDGCVEKPDEVIVVNGGDEQADRVVEEFQRQDKVSVRLVKTVNRNLATSRNVGLTHCRGDIVAMTDDDAEVFPDWVTRMKEVHREQLKAGAVGGLVIGSNVESLVGKVADAITFPIWPTACSVRTLPGVNISYKREVLDQVGPQDETLARSEDVDFNWRVKRLGYTVYFDPSIKVYHHHRPTLRGFLNQHYMYGRSYYVVRRKWPDMYCIYPHQFRKPKDVLKAINVVASSFYQPFLSTRRISGWWDRVRALPFLFLAGLAWKGGMLEEAWRQRRLRHRQQTTEAQKSQRLGTKLNVVE
jgi:glycosyltransferase involved in cell wall biosynthesis